MESCLIIAGEKSGEEHAMSFFPELLKKVPGTFFFGVGGDELKAQGLEIYFHLNDFSSWGYSEVLAKIPFYKRAMNEILAEVEKRNCKVAILIDFQSFNLKLAEKLENNGVKVLYFVAPQAWAWKEYRVKKLSKVVDTLFTIIPFEKKWFKDRGVKKVISVDHPQLRLHELDLKNFERKPFQKEKIKILLLPGSRHFEVNFLLEEFLNGVELFKQKNQNIKIEIQLVKSSSVNEILYAPFNGRIQKIYTNLELSEALKNADFAIAASGTVTLSCALYSLPTIVNYKGSLLNYFIYESFVSYSGPISLANIVHNCSVFPELIQDRVSAFNIASILNIWYHDNSIYRDLLSELQKTTSIVKGESLDVAEYMGEAIRSSYGKKFDTIN